MRRVSRSLSSVGLGGQIRSRSQQLLSRISPCLVNSRLRRVSCCEAIVSSCRLHCARSYRTKSTMGIRGYRNAEREPDSPSVVAKYLKRAVHYCQECTKAQRQRSQPLTRSALPELPWQKVTTDLFEWKQEVFLLLVDYYSRYVDIACLNRLTPTDVIIRTKSISARHGIPETVISDNGPSFIPGLQGVRRLQTSDKQPLLPSEQWGSKEGSGHH